MAAQWRVYLAVTLTALMASAALADAAPGSGRLRVSDAMTFDGTVTSEPGSGTLMLGSPQFAAPTGAHVAISAVTISVARVTWSDNLQNPLPVDSPVDSRTQPTVKYANFTDAKASLAALQPDGTLLLTGANLDASGTRVSLASPTLRGVTKYVLVRSVAKGESGTPDGTKPADFSYVATGVFELATRGAVNWAAASPLLTMYLDDGALTVTDGNGDHTFTAGAESTTLAPGLPNAIPQQGTQYSYLVVQLMRAAGTVTSDGGAASWFETQPALHLEGGAGALAADGTIVLHGVTQDTSYSVNDESLTIKGALDLLATRTTSTAVAATDPGNAWYDPEFRADVSGDIQSISVLAASRTYTDTSETAAVATGVGALLLLAYFWPVLKWYGTLVALPLYSRISRPDILDNDVRNGIYDIIRRNPGISARAVHRETGQSWGTVVYHLRQLERHELVTSRRVGRSRNFYENHGKYRGMEMEIAVLKSPRNLAIAQIVLTVPGLTQEDLAGRAVLPQPTTSYYVRKLKEVNLIREEREGRYARYFPTPELARLVAIASGAAQTLAPSPDTPPESTPGTSS